MNQCIGYNSIVRTNGTTITYAYNQINNTTGVVEKQNIQESFVLTPNQTELINANNVILKAINDRLNPITKVILGTIQIKYQDDKGNLLEDVAIYNNLPMGNNYFTAKNYDGMTISGNITQCAVLSETNPNQTIVFTYTKNVTTTTDTTK